MNDRPNKIAAERAAEQYADVQGYTDRQRLVDVIESAMDRQVRAAVYDERLRCARVIARFARLSTTSACAARG